VEIKTNQGNQGNTASSSKRNVLKFAEILVTLAHATLKIKGKNSRKNLNTLFLFLVLCQDTDVLILSMRGNTSVLILLVEIRINQGSLGNTVSKPR